MKLLKGLLLLLAFAMVVWVCTLTGKADGVLQVVNGTMQQGGSTITGLVMTNGNVNAFVISTNNQVTVRLNTSSLLEVTNFAASNLGITANSNGTVRLGFGAFTTPAVAIGAANSGVYNSGAQIVFVLGGVECPSFAPNALLITTNYTASQFAPVAGYVKVASSNGVLYKITQTSTNLLNSTVP